MTEQESIPVERFHATEPPRGLSAVVQSQLFEGRFGRMFRNLPSFAPTDHHLEQLAATMFEPEQAGGDGGDGGDGADPLDNPDIPAGFTYLGQFVDHDITFDPTSVLQRQNDPNALLDFRTPRYDLDSVYGRGPSDQPYLYQDDGVHLRIGKNGAGEDDLPRTAPDGAGARRALIGDPRNDENLIVSQLQLAFLKFHNAVVDRVAQSGLSGDALLAEAQRQVRWHYQWIVVHEFLPTIAGQPPVDDVLQTETFTVDKDGAAQQVTIPTVKRLFYHWHNEPFMPVEFSVGAYRFGHSMIRPEYELNDNAAAQNRPIFSQTQPDLRGFRERPAQLEIQWRRFFAFPNTDATQLQHARLIDTLLAPGLAVLPPPVVAQSDPHHSLAERNLLRGKALGLPPGQAVARAMGLPDGLILTGNALGLPANLVSAFGQVSPLWFYILREAQQLNGGHHLGPVGGRIVAEVLLGLLDGDPFSYLSVQPTWTPTLPAQAPGTFTMVDLLTLAGVTI